MYRFEMTCKGDDSPSILAEFDTLNQALSFKSEMQQRHDNSYTYMIIGPDIIELTT